MLNPSDVIFVGPTLDQLFVTSIAVDLGWGAGELAGCLLSCEAGLRGRPEHRFRLP